EAFFIAIDAVGARDFPLWLEVCQQREAQLPILGEGRMAPDAVDGDAQDVGAVSVELGEQLVVDGELVAAYGTPVGRIESEDDPATSEVSQRDCMNGPGVE